MGEPRRSIWGHSLGNSNFVLEKPRVMTKIRQTCPPGHVTVKKTTNEREMLQQDQLQIVESRTKLGPWSPDSPSRDRDGGEEPAKPPPCPDLGTGRSSGSSSRAPTCFAPGKRLDDSPPPDASLSAFSQFFLISNPASSTPRSFDDAFPLLRPPPSPAPS